MLHLVLIVWFWLPEIVLEYLSREPFIYWHESVLHCIDQNSAKAVVPHVLLREVSACICY